MYQIPWSELAWIACPRAESDEDIRYECLLLFELLSMIDVQMYSGKKDQGAALASLTAACCSLRSQCKSNALQIVLRACHRPGGLACLFDQTLCSLKKLDKHYLAPWWLVSRSLQLMRVLQVIDQYVWPQYSPCKEQQVIEFFYEVRYFRFCLDI